MTRFRTRALTALAVAAFTTPAFAGPPAADEKPWYSRMLSGGSRPADSKISVPSRPPVIIAPPPPEVLAEALKAEQDAYVRRLDICTKLRQIAASRNDDALTQKADELESLAAAMYQERVARLGVKGKSRRSAAAALDRQLGPGAMVDPLKVTAPTPAGRDAAAKQETP